MLIIICSNAFAGPAKTVYSITNNGSVTNSSDWSTTPGGSSCSCTPDFSKDVVNIRTNINASSAITVQNGATLNISNNVTFNVTGKLTFNNGSIVNVSSGSTLYASGDIENKNNSDEITINGVLSAGEDFIGGSGSTLTGSGSLATVGTATLTGGSVFGSSTSCTSGPCNASASNPLPVDLLYFTAKLNDSFNVELDWSTASEINNSFFTAERSKDGIFFETVVKVNGQGNSHQVIDYHSEDSSPLPGTSFYRLKQVDFDGTTSYSKIVAVNANQADVASANFGFTVFPNPSNASTNLVFHQLENEEQLYLQVYDFSGRVIFNDFIYARNGSVTNLDVTKFEAGIYIVNVSMNEYSAQQKVIVSGK